MKIEGLKTERSQRQIAYLAAYSGLFFGLLAMGAGIFGVWLQGGGMDDPTRYLSIADSLLPSEVIMGICLPAMVTTAGGLAIAWVILASKLTEKRSAKWKNLIFATFAIIYVIAIFIPGKIMGDKIWAKAAKAEAEYFEKQRTNAPTAPLVKPKENH